MNRCINLDWLECYVLEPPEQPHDVDYFGQSGFYVEQRDYGTRIYEQMFTLYSFDEHYPMIEVRRQPKSVGVLPFNAAHIRFNNRYCYFDNAGELMRLFIEKYHYTFVSISRVDICLDFEKFDSGDDPAKFIKRYIGHKYAKINQAQARAHFNDEWERRDFNSLSWGSKNSDITTKLYNKTLELYDEKLGAFKKPYIIQSWFADGLVSDPVRVVNVREDGTEYRPVIWRLEFSIKSNVKGWMAYEMDGDQKKIRSVRNTLEQYLNRPMLIPIFDLLQQHYFHFKKFKAGVAKYNCKDKVLFDFKADENFYKVVKPASPSKPDALVIRLRRYLGEYISTKATPELAKAANTIIDDLEAYEQARFTSNEHDRRQLQALRETIARKMQGDETAAMELYREILKLLTSEAVY